MAQPEKSGRRTEEEFGGAEGIRTPDPHNAIVVLCQLSYDPKSKDLESARKILILSKHYSGSAGKVEKKIELTMLAGILSCLRKY